MSALLRVFRLGLAAAFLPLAFLTSTPAVGQGLSVNPYQGLTWEGSHEDVCKTPGQSGVAEGARHTADNISEGIPLEVNNCHLHPVETTFQYRTSSVTLCHPAADSTCGDPGWCSDPCSGTSCGGTGCLSRACPVVATTHEVLAPSFNYQIPLSADPHTLLITVTRQAKNLQGNCTCTPYSQAVCPPPGTPGTPGGSDNGGPPLDDDRDGYNEIVDPDDRNPNVTPGSGDARCRWA